VDTVSLLTAHEAVLQYDSKIAELFKMYRKRGGSIASAPTGAENANELYHVVSYSNETIFITKLSPFAQLDKFSLSWKETGPKKWKTILEFL